MPKHLEPKPAPVPLPASNRVRRPSGRVMHEITRFDSVGAKAIVYYRELEQLASIVEDQLEVLRDNPDAHAIKYVADRLDEALDRIYALSKGK